MAIGTNDTAAAHGNHRVSITINAPLEMVYKLWTNFENFPRYLNHISQVQTSSQNPLIQHWKGNVFGVEQEWDAEITTVTPPHIIAWRSIKGFENSGSLTFERRESTNQLGGGTTLTVQVGYNPPLGVFGDVAEALWYKQRFDEGLEEDMTRFNELCERLYVRMQERTKSGESMEAAMAEALGNEQISVDHLPTSPEPAQYEMSYTPSPNIITTTELKNRLQWGEVGFTILDVRLPEIYQHGHIQGASNAPLAMLEEYVEKIVGPMRAEGERQIIVYSESGDDLSARAAHRLYELGYRQVLDYTDGFSAWISANQAVEMPSAEQILNKGLPEKHNYSEHTAAVSPEKSDIPKDLEIKDSQQQHNRPA
jgi:uncharacterized membrane protein/rhodanese-related sulfurtransferase